MSDPGTSSGLSPDALAGPPPVPMPGETTGPSGLSADALAGVAAPVKSGWLADLTTAQTGVGRVLHYFGQGAADLWGAKPITTKPVETWLGNPGGWDQFAERQGGILKGFNEAVVRPAAAALDNRINAAESASSSYIQGQIEAMGAEGKATPSSIWQGFAGAPEAAWTSLKNDFIRGIGISDPEKAKAFQSGTFWDQAKAMFDQQIALGKLPWDAFTTALSPVGGAIGAGTVAAGKGVHALAPAIPQKAVTAALNQAIPWIGPAGEPLAAAAAERPPWGAVDLAKARATGVIGNGEEGFFNVKPMDAQEIARRTEAANDAGIDPATVIKPQPVPTVDELARKVDPEAFAQLDQLKAQHGQLLDQTDQMAQARIATPEAQAAQAKIDGILGKVGGVESRLTKTARTRLAAAQEDLDSILRSTTPEMDAINAQRTEVGAKMQPIFQRVQDAYRHASDMLGETAGQEPFGAPSMEAQIGAADHAGLDAIEADLDQQLAKLSPESYQEFTNEGVTIPVGAEQKATGAAAEGGGETGGRPSASETGAQPATGRGAAPALGAESEPAWGPGSGGITQPQPEYARPAAAERGAAADLAFRETLGTGELKPYGASRNIETSAIEKGLVKDFGDNVPMRQAVSFKHNAARIAEILKNNDAATVFDMAMGRAPIPVDVVPKLFVNELERIADREGDLGMLRALANSPYTKQVSEAGLIMRAEQERDQFSVVKAIQQVNKARQGAEDVAAVETPAETTAAAEKVPQIKAAVRARASVNKLQAFIDTITCEV